VQSTIHISISAKHYFHQSILQFEETPFLSI